MKVENQVLIEFPSKSVNEAYARSAVACFAAQLDPTLEELGDIKTAVSEAVTNAIVHGYRDTIGTITVKCRILPDQTLDITIKQIPGINVADDLGGVLQLSLQNGQLLLSTLGSVKGCGIEDVKQARTPMFTTGGEERSGMGFTIMESFMHELKVTSKPGKGTSVHMKRKIMKRGGRL